MAEFPVTNFTAGLQAAGLNPNNPAMTGVDFANTMATNQLQQQEMEANIARAKQMAEQAAASLMTPTQANTYVKAILEGKGLLDSAASDAIDKWTASLGDEQVDSGTAETFANRLSGEKTKAAQPFVATQADADSDKQDENGDPLIAGQTYTALYDNSGNVTSYVRGGSNPTPGGTSAADKQANVNNNRWSKLDAAINLFIKSSRGNQITMALVRAARALNELANGEVLTPQVLSYIQKDISGIFQGGVPAIAGMAGEDFTTAYQQINAFIAKYTGIQGYLHSDLGNQRDYLINLLTRLRESCLDILHTMIVSEAAGYQDIVDQNPQRWQDMVNQKIATTTAGLSATAAAATAAAASPTTPQATPGVKTSVAAPKIDVNALGAFLKLPKKGQ